MRKLMTALAVLCLSLPALASAPGYTTVMATSITDATGNPLVSGTATFQVMDANGRALPVKLTGGGQIITEPVSVLVTNGAFTAQVVDVSQTQPSFACVSLTIVDNASGQTVWSNNCLQPVGGTYSLDQFSTNTSPILPQAGDTVQGDLGVNGNLNVTGNLNIGGFSTANLTATLANIKSLNGNLNAALFSGADIGAQVNSAYATCSDSAPCHVYVPAGNYTYSTPILLPRLTLGIELTIDHAATLTYTGTGDAIGTQPIVNGTANLSPTVIEGGGKIIGTASANSGVHIRPGQGFVVRDLTIVSFSNGDGIWIDGANVVTLTGNTASQNLNGLHVTGNVCNASNQCNWDRNASGTWVSGGYSGVNGYAPNALTVKGNRFTTNKQWGILEMDVIGGSVSQAFNNSYENNDLEGNGTLSSSFGAALTGYSVNSTFAGNYFEGDPRGIVVGCVAGDAGAATPSGYSAQFCGNATNTVVERNFFNDGTGADEVYFAHAIGPKVVHNDKHGSATCLADEGTAIGDIQIESNQLDTGNAVCQGGTPGGPLINFREFGDSTLVAKHFGGSVQIDNLLTTAEQITGSTDRSTMTGAQIIGKFGAVTLWQSTSAPAGSCGGANTFNIWFAPSGLYVCPGASTWKLVSAS